jgi:mercuric ion transport protein
VSPVADKRLVATGLAGIAAAALCCFTPVLATLLTALGLSAVVPNLDYVLLPVAAVSLALLVYGAMRRRRA